MNTPIGFTVLEGHGIRYYDFQGGEYDQWRNEALDVSNTWETRTVSENQTTLEFEFDQPVSLVSIDSISAGGLGDFFGCIEVYDHAHDQIGKIWTDPLSSEGEMETLSIGFSKAVIKYMHCLTGDDTAGRFANLSVSIGSVPSPPTNLRISD